MKRCAFITAPLVLSAALAFAAEEVDVRMYTRTEAGEMLSWEAEHLGSLNDPPTTMRLTTRVRLRNTGDEPAEARRFHLQMPDGENTVTLERKRPLQIPPGGEVVATLYTEEQVSIDLRMVYDGVRPDRFRRDPKVDWAYGTDYTPAVQWQASFRNPFAAPLPTGFFTLMQMDAKHPPIYIGRAWLPFLRAAEEAELNLGRAANFSGQRIRTAYQEVVPGQVFEETFAIALHNQTERDQTVYVRERLYRGGTPSILNADERYQMEAPGVILFRVRAPAGADKTLHYTVRYLW